MSKPITNKFSGARAFSFAALSLVVLSSTACDGENKETPAADPPEKQTVAEKGAEAGADKAAEKTDGKDTGAKDPGADAKAGDAAAANNCKLYCMNGKVPCGDKCLAAGESCDGTPEGSACAEDKYVPRKFKKGDRVLQGMVRADVPAFNKAQGDPIDGFFTLEQAFEGAPELADKSKGKLFATIKTDMGDIRCELFEDKTPLTVANFVGLARGKRPWFDKKAKAWAAKPYYENTLIHRVIDGFMIQMGDHTGSGRGGPGYMIPDEFDPALKHSGPGTLSMANRNRPDPRSQKLRVDPKTGQTIGNTGSSQFFVTVAKGGRAGYLDGRHTVFGKCAPKTAMSIGKVPTRKSPPALKDRPVQDVKLQTITFERAEK